MWSLLRSPRAKIFGVMSASVGWSVALLYARDQLSRRATYHFLVWNLFLAAIPFVASNAMVWLAPRRGRLARAAVYALSAVWLLFLPNAPYILTDLYHLHWEDRAMPLWYDMALILSFAWNGLLLGYLSLMDVQSLVARRQGPRWGRGLAVASLGLSGFGIYVGRFLRWNSWDVVSHPRALARAIAAPMLEPTLHPRAVGFTCVFSVFLVLGYVSLRALVALHAPRATAT